MCIVIVALLAGYGREACPNEHNRAPRIILPSGLPIKHKPRPVMTLAVQLKAAAMIGSMRLGDASYLQLRSDRKAHEIGEVG